ncbi:hypothetical protein [Clostridium intestinale]|uniref:hypothetical protein n=1 Tax=Clostridium intestinale TaxID=36845 RepID=UPI002DD635BF|nr:hypothetical protein [Clostridium intestinale]WRY49498.1 hypothetical protein P8F83_12255 [Clostridium intestinale]
MDGIKAEEVKGFETLKVSQNMFKTFLNKFISAWGEGARNTIVPLEVSKVKGKSYLRFDYMIYGRKKWLHVTGPNTWY